MLIGAEYKMGGYLPQREDIKRLFKGDESYFDEAAEIVERWCEEVIELYRIWAAELPEYYQVNEDELFSKDDFLETGYFDIITILEAHNMRVSEQDIAECHIVWMALDGVDPYEGKDLDTADFKDEDDCYDDDEFVDFEED